jgi:acetyl esterase/lipase
MIKFSETELNMELKNIILVGDSAGGNLIAALMQLIIYYNKKIPNAVFLGYPGIIFNYLYYFYQFPNYYLLII